MKHDFDGESLFRVQSLIYRDADFDIQLVYKLINLKIVVHHYFTNLIILGVIERGLIMTSSTNVKALIEKNINKKGSIMTKLYQLF